VHGPIRPLPLPHASAFTGDGMLLACSGRGLMKRKYASIVNLSLNTLPVGENAEEAWVAYGYMGCGARDILGTNILVAPFFGPKRSNRFFAI
jgi:hypothetical protein